MGVNGCGWARMGAMWYRGTGGHENKASIKKNGCEAHNLGPMAGEISPDIMFLVVWQKMVEMSADGYRSVALGAYRCMGKKGSKNKAKSPQSGRAGGIFVMSDDSKKRQEVGRDSLGDQRGSWGRMGGKQEARSMI